MPELPEVEAARALLQRRALGVPVAAAQDDDEYVCRPHAPGDIDAALRGRTITAAGRRGKAMWLETDDDAGPRLGLHLGMAGRIVIEQGDRAQAAGDPQRPGERADELDIGPREPSGAAGAAREQAAVSRESADASAQTTAASRESADAHGDAAGAPREAAGRPVGAGRAGPPGRAEDPEPPTRRPVWERFALRLADGTRVVLLDRRRLARVVLEPDLSRLGPDAMEISRADFRRRVGRGSAPLKARLMDQSVLAGAGNLLVDEVLWQAAQPPLRPAGDLDETELDELRRVLRRCTRRAMRRGGVHTGDVIAHRRREATCPRCGADMTRATVGGRTTWWCAAEQDWPR